LSSFIAKFGTQTTSATLNLQVDGDRLTTTPEHPFYTQDRGWVAATDLRLGERVRKARFLRWHFRGSPSAQLAGYDVRALRAQRGREEARTRAAPEHCANVCSRV